MTGYNNIIILFLTPRSIFQPCENLNKACAGVGMIAII